MLKGWVFKRLNKLKQIVSFRDDTGQNEQFHINEAESDDESETGSAKTNFSFVPDNQPEKNPDTMGLTTVSKATDSNFHVVPLTSQL